MNTRESIGFSPYNMDYFMEEMMFTENEMKNPDRHFAELLIKCISAQLIPLYQHSTNSMSLILKFIQMASYIFLSNRSKRIKQ